MHGIPPQKRFDIDKMIHIIPQKMGEKMKKYIFIHSVGTSVLTNTKDAAMRILLNEHSNLEEKEISGENLGKIQDFIRDRHKEFLENRDDRKFLKKNSAELNGFFTYIEEKKISKQDILIHYLIQTDTFLGSQTGAIVKEILEDYGPVQEIKGTGLNVKNRETFQGAIKGLVEKIVTGIIIPHKIDSFFITANLSGGFKSLNGFLQTILGMYADEVFYLFEKNAGIVTIPRLPLKVALELDDRDAILFRRLLNGLDVESTSMKKSRIPDALYTQMEDQIILSEWGEMLAEKYREDFYTGEILPSISDKMVVEESFQRGAKNHKERVSQINQQLDAVAVFLEKGSNPQSLSFKEYKNGYKGNTHEFYVWSDGGAYRGFGVFDEKNIFHVKLLEPHP